jgi:hypothetical protein
LSRQLAAEAGASLDADPTLSYRLAEAAVAVEPTLPAQLALFARSTARPVSAA